MSLPQLFGIIPTGSPCITAPTSSPSPTSYLFRLPASPRAFSHIVVFLLPGIELPPDCAAAVYIALPTPASSSASAPDLAPQPQPQPAFRFLGAVGPGKESAVFRVSGLGGSNSSNDTGGSSSSSNTGGEVDMDAPEGAGTGGGAGAGGGASGAAGWAQGGEIVLGIDLEAAAAVNAKMVELASSSLSSLTAAASSSALVVANNSTNSRRHQPQTQRPAAGMTETLALAQRIIKNAFNFLASFSGNVPVPGGQGAAGVEVVPLKAFEDWWRKFETRIRNDPRFLEKDVD